MKRRFETEIDQKALDVFNFGDSIAAQSLSYARKWGHDVSTFFCRLMARKENHEPGICFNFGIHGKGKGDQT